MIVDDLPQMTGKVILITGATSGIGRVTAERLACAGGQVVLVGRNQEKTARTAMEVAQKAGVQVDFLIADLSVQSEIRRMVEEFRNRYCHLHVLINNAGAFFGSYRTSRDGFEMTFALNHLAYFLLTHLLLDVIIASAPARVVNVSSWAHFGWRLAMNHRKKPVLYNGWATYSRSKLANLYFTYELARRLAGKGVTANALHPGFVATNLGRTDGSLVSLFFRMIQVGAISPEEGAKTMVYLAASPAIEGVSGKYFNRCKIVPSSRVSYDQQTARLLWDASLKMTGLGEINNISSFSV